MTGKIAIGLRVPVLIVHAVEMPVRLVLPVAVPQKGVQSHSVLGRGNLPGIGLADGRNQVRPEDGLAHKAQGRAGSIRGEIVPVLLQVVAAMKFSSKKPW